MRLAAIGGIALVGCLHCGAHPPSAVTIPPSHDTPPAAPMPVRWVLHATADFPTGTRSSGLAKVMLTPLLTTADGVVGIQRSPHATDYEQRWFVNHATGLARPSTHGLPFASNTIVVGAIALDHRFAFVDDEGDVAFTNDPLGPAIETTAPPHPLRGVSVVGHSIAGVFGNQLYRSEDGRTWSSTMIPARGDVRAIELSNDGIVVARATLNELFVSVDSGAFTPLSAQGLGPDRLVRTDAGEVFITTVSKTALRIVREGNRAIAVPTAAKAWAKTELAFPVDPDAEGALFKLAGAIEGYPYFFRRENFTLLRWKLDSPTVDHLELPDVPACRDAASGKRTENVVTGDRHALYFSCSHLDSESKDYETQVLVSTDRGDHWQVQATTKGRIWGPILPVEEERYTGTWYAAWSSDDKTPRLVRYSPSQNEIVSTNIIAQAPPSRSALVVAGHGLTYLLSETITAPAMDALWVSRDGTFFAPIELPIALAKKDESSDEVLSPGFGYWRAMSVDSASGEFAALVSAMIVRVPWGGPSRVAPAMPVPMATKAGSMFGRHLLLDTGGHLLESFDLGAKFTEVAHPKSELPIACFAEGCAIGNGLRLGQIDSQNKPFEAPTPKARPNKDIACTADPSVLAFTRKGTAKTNTWARQSPWYVVEDTDDAVVVQRAVADKGALSIASVELATRRAPTDLRYVAKQPEGVAVVSARVQRAGSDVTAVDSLNLTVTWWNARTDSVHHASLQTAAGTGDLDARDKLAHFRPAVFSMTDDGVFLSPFSVGKKLFWVANNGQSQLVVDSPTPHSCARQQANNCGVFWIDHKPVVATTEGASNIAFDVWAGSDWQLTAWALGKSQSLDYASIWRGQPALVTQTDTTIWLTPLQLSTESPVPHAIGDYREPKNLLRACKEVCEAGKNCANVPFQFGVSLEPPADSDTPILATTVNRHKFHATSALLSEDDHGTCTQSLTFSTDDPKPGELIVWLAHPEMSTLFEDTDNAKIAHPARCQLP